MLARYPLPILVTSLVLALLSIFPITQIHWDLQLQDALSLGKKSTDYHEIQKNFGGLGSLTVVIKSEDSTYNYKVAESLYKQLKNDSLVHFIDFQTDIEFYKKHNLLYIETSDLDTIYKRLDSLKQKIILKNNPLFVDIENNLDSTSKQNIDFAKNFNLKDVEKKYLEILSTSHASSDGKIRVIDIYPKESLSSLKACRALHTKVQNILKEKNVETFYTGKVYDTILTGKTLLPEAKFAGKMTALFILLLFIIHFYKQPKLILISIIPAGIPILYTLALAGIIYGRINLFTLLLALFLPGQACQIIIHVLNRYFIERKNNLGPELSTESAVLGIGPSTAVSACIMSGIFLSLYLVPINGLQELSILGAIGSILNWGICILLTTTLLQLFQKEKSILINPFHLKHKYKFKLLKYSTNKLFIFIISSISLICLYYGYNLKFFYDFEQTEINHQINKADSLITQTGFPHYDPIIVMLPDQSYGDELLENYKLLKKKNRISTIDKIYTLAQFSPKNQIEKKEKIKNIQQIISNDFLNKLDSNELHYVSKLKNRLYNIDFEESETPENIRLKFSGNKNNSGIFAYIFYNINPNDGLECRHLQTDLNKFEGIENNTFKISGTPVVRAKFLDLVLKNIDKSLIIGFILIWFFLLLYYNRFSRSIFTLLPSLFAMSWLIFLLHFFEIELSAYSSLAFPILFAFSVDGSLQIWSAYYEKQSGTSLNILQNKFFTVGISQMASLIGTYGLLISSHPGLKSIGQICLLGLICISISQFTIFPLIAGALDNYRLHKQKKIK